MDQINVPRLTYYMKRALNWLAFIFLGSAISLFVAVIILQRYKKEIIATVTQMFQESMNGEIQIGDYHITVFHNFPDISISLRDVKVYGPQYQTYQPAFLNADRIDVNVEPIKLFRKEISIKSVDISNGQVSIFRTSTGYTNLEVFKTEHKTDSSTQRENVLLDLKTIRLQNVVALYVDSTKAKNFSIHFITTENSITSADSMVLFHIGGEIKIIGLMLNQAKGLYLKNKRAQANLNITLDPIRNQALISPSSLIFEKSTVNLSGALQLSTREFQLDIQSPQLDYEEGLSILADTLAKKLGRYQIEKPVELKLHIHQLEPGSLPEVNVVFAFKDSNAKAGKVEMKNMSLEGVFTNHVDTALLNDDRNSQLRFTTMRGILNNLPMEGTVTLTDLVDPSMQLNATFDTDLKRLNDNLDTTKIKMIAGHFTSSFSYSGKLNEYLDETKTKYDGKLNGEARISKGRLLYTTKNLHIDNLDATFSFTEKEFEIKRLGLRVNNNPVFLKGSVTDFIPFFTTLETTGKVKLAITSPRLDISGLFQPQQIEKAKAEKAKSLERIGAMAEILNRKLGFDINYDVKELINKDFRASNANGTLILSDNRLILKKAAMEFAQGTVEFNLSLTNLHQVVSPFTLDAKLQDVAIKEFFHSFNNFNQTTFQDDHVNGTLSMDINFNAEIDNKLQVLTPNLRADANFQILNCELTDFDPMQRLSNFLFKGRDFSNIQFGEINSEISMKGTAIDVRRMEIQSTALSMFIEGRYDLEDSSDLSIQIPLSNLKKRDQDFAPQNIGTDAKVGASVFLRVHPDNNGKTTISYDPFKKFRKK